jgi:ribonuclease HI
VVNWCNAAVAGASCSRLEAAEERTKLIFNPEKPTKIERVVIHADGASRGNPGPAAIGATIKEEDGRLLCSISQAIGQTTNNQAEYRAVIAALEEAARLGARQASVYLDSELIVKQINGKYRVKNRALKPLYQQVKQWQSRFESFNITHVPRQQNKEADNLANAALKD